jgi:hypothetical protein
VTIINSNVTRQSQLTLKPVNMCVTYFLLAVAVVSVSLVAVHCDHNDCTALTAVGCIVIAYIASTPPAPGTPLHNIPGKDAVASANLVYHFMNHTYTHSKREREKRHC